VAGQAGPVAVGAGVAGLGLSLLFGARTIAGEAPYAGVGPRAFPVLIGTGLAVLGIAFLVAVRRGMAGPPAAALASRGALPWILGGLVAATLLLDPLGFPAAATVLFVCAARGFESRRWVGNALVGAALGLVIYVAFSRALGVTLPGGPLFSR
jgi:putative tricarboxylic transport membrane protein